jgi:hypothetical protein
MPHSPCGHDPIYLPPSPPETVCSTPSVSPTIQQTSANNTIPTRKGQKLISKQRSPNTVLQAPFNTSIHPVILRHEKVSVGVEVKEADWILESSGKVFAIIHPCHCQGQEKHRHCACCDKTTSSRIRAYEKHMRTHIDNEPKDGIICEYCGLLISRKSLRRHLYEKRQITEEAKLPYTATDASNTLFAVRTTARGAPYITHADNAAKQCYATQCSQQNSCNHLASIQHEQPIRRNVPLEPAIPVSFVEKAKFLSISELQFITQFQVSHGLLTGTSMILQALKFIRKTVWIPVYMA